MGPFLVCGVAVALGAVSAAASTGLLVSAGTAIPAHSGGVAKVAEAKPSVAPAAAGTTLTASVKQQSVPTPKTKGNPKPKATTKPQAPSKQRPLATTKPLVTTKATAKPANKTTTTTTASPAPAAPGGSSVLSAKGGQLMLEGHPYRDVGLNAYELATDWGVNAGCGTMLDDAQLNSFFAQLPTHTLVRIWAWQGTMAVNVHTGQIDWSPLDRVFSAAATHGDLLVVSLTSQSGGCDDNHWKGASWYSGGYRQTYGPNANGLTLPLSYWNYVQQIVSRYASSPALGMWEPVNEPEASTCAPGFTADSCYGNLTCPDETAAANAMRSFFDTVGGEIHALDPRHLVESGFLGSGQCGTSGPDYAYVGASRGIDVLSYHDYYPASAAVGGDQWNGIALRVQQAASLNKPLIGGESGITAGNAAGCISLPTRQADAAARIQAQMQLGISAILFWDWVPDPSNSTSCSYDIGTGDPLMSLLGVS